MTHSGRFFLSCFLGLGALTLVVAAPVDAGCAPVYLYESDDGSLEAAPAVGYKDCRRAREKAREHRSHHCRDHKNCRLVEFVSFDDWSPLEVWVAVDPETGSYGVGKGENSFVAKHNAEQSCKKKNGNCTRFTEIYGFR